MEEKLRLLKLNDDDKNGYSSPRVLRNNRIIPRAEIKSKNKKNKNIDNIQLEVNLTVKSNSVITPLVNIVDYSDSESTLTVNDEIDEGDLDTFSVNDEIEECDFEEKIDQSKEIQYYEEEEEDIESHVQVLDESTEKSIEPIFTFTTKGKPKMVYGDQEYMYEKTHGEKIYWRCTVSKPIQCNARIHTNLEKKIVKLKKGLQILMKNRVP